MHAKLMNPARKPLHLLLATLVVALAAGVAQTATAQPHQGPGPAGMHDAMDAMGDMGGMPGMDGGAGGRHGRHGAPGMRMQRMLDAANATPEQRAQVKKILDGLQADMAAQRDTRRQLHERGMSVFTAPNVDANAAEALRQQMLAQHDQASKRRMQAMLDISRVFTPEQRKALADRMVKMRSMMERHRAERDALEQRKN